RPKPACLLQRHAGGPLPAGRLCPVRQRAAPHHRRPGRRRRPRPTGAAPSPATPPSGAPRPTPAAPATARSLANQRVNRVLAQLVTAPRSLSAVAMKQYQAVDDREIDRRRQFLTEDPLKKADFVRGRERQLRMEG